MAKRWLITGATGLLAHYLMESRPPGDVVATTARTGGDLPCDLRDAKATQELISRTSPDIVLHAAGLTDVDYCEQAPDQAYAVNRDSGANIASVLPPQSRLVFISSDQVYPDTPGPHREEIVAPVNVYAQSKLAGEQAVLAHAGALVLRTNFFGPSRRAGRTSLSDFVIQSLTARRPVTLFSDILFSPLHMTTFAALVVELAQGGLTGVFNAGSRNGASKADFALAIAKLKNLQTETARIGSSETLPGRAPRPKDMRLAVDRLETAIGRPMPTLKQEIAKL